MGKKTTAKKLNLIISADKSPKKVGDITIDLSEIDGWEDLTDVQQSYLLRLSQNPLKPRTITAQMGLSRTGVDNWFNEDTFSSIAQFISDVYIESMKELDFEDAITDSKIRNRVIQSLERGGKYTEDPKEENHQHVHITMADFLESKKD